MDAPPPTRHPWRRLLAYTVDWVSIIGWVLILLLAARLLGLLDREVSTATSLLLGGLAGVLPMTVWFPGGSPRITGRPGVSG